jgi:hypothetical protein
MPAQTVRIGLLLIAGFLAVSPVSGGYYNTADTARETAWSPDYENVFRNVLADLQLISNPTPGRDPPIRRRYLLMEALGKKGVGDLTLEQSLDYSAVLIRRGKLDEAAELLVPLTRLHPENFIVHSHCATAHFLSATPDFRSNATSYMREALKLWPQHWNDVKEDQKNFLESMRWEETAFLRYRRYETYFELLMKNRFYEERQAKKKMPVPEAVDPIFLGSDGTPVRFLNEKGEFEVGRIAETEKKKLPPDYIEAIEQLLIWMPNDDRLLWLLGDALNASAMDRRDADPKKQEIAKNQAIWNAAEVYKQLTTNAFNGMPIFARKEIDRRYKEILEPYMKTMPDRFALDPNLIPEKGGDPAPLLSNDVWWRALTVGFVVGFAVGIFALLQFQETRRRRQARLTVRDS